MNKSIQISTIILAGTLLMSTPALAVDEYNVSTGVTTASAPLALRGVDAVALSSSGADTNGVAAFTAVYDGVAYYFASAESKAKFTENPTKYMPQFGGFCAFAVSLGKKFNGNPKYADIVDGNLYVFVNAAVFAEYKKDKTGVLTKAKATWSSIRSKAVGEL